MWPFNRKTPKTPTPIPVAPPAPPTQQPFEYEYRQLARVVRYRSELTEHQGTDDAAFEREMAEFCGIPKHWIPLQGGPKTEAPFIPPTPPAALRGNSAALAAWNDFHSSLSGCDENPMHRYGPMKPANPPPVLTLGNLAKYRRDRELAGYVTIEDDPAPREITHPWKS